MDSFSDLFARRATQHLPSTQEVERRASGPHTIAQAKAGRLDAQGRLARGSLPASTSTTGRYRVIKANAGDLTLRPVGADTRGRRAGAQLDARGRLQLGKGARHQLAASTVLVIAYTDSTLRLVSVERCLQSLETAR